MKTSNLTVEPRFSSRGFTLVELMVVIVIIVVLVSLVVTGLTRMRAQGYKVTAMNNIRQLQTANAAYATENNGVYVQAWSFDEDLNQSPAKWNVNEEFLGYFRGSVPADAPRSIRLGIPEKLLDPLVVKTKGPRWDRLEKSFGINITTFSGGRNNTANSVRSLRTTQLQTPSRTAAFLTGQNAFLTHSGRFAYNGTEENSGNTTTAYRHNDRAVVVFYDGHVEMKSMEDMREIDKKGGARHPFWKGFK